jgi:hypothetical protein
MLNRSVREFSFNSDFWPQVDNWAAAAGFTLELDQGLRRRYRKGNRLIMAPVCVEISQSGGKVKLEAWIKADMYLIMALLTSKPAEAAIQSGGLTAWIPRKRARMLVNPLLVSLGQPPID